MSQRLNLFSSQIPRYYKQIEEKLAVPSTENNNNSTDETENLLLSEYLSQRYYEWNYYRLDGQSLDV